jgi:molybdenum cofactor cytidylyltransferase
VIPASTTLLVPVVGIDAIGAPLDNEHVHRAERVAELAGVKIGSTVEPGLVARVIASERGGLKNRPPEARVTPLINKAENVAQLLIARDVAGKLLRDHSMQTVVIGTVRNASLPVAEVHSQVAAIVLAAGGSARMRGPLKQLLPWGDSTLVRHIVDVVNRAQVAEIVLVVGKQAEEVERQFAFRGSIERCRLVHNPDWERGRSTSVRAGLETVGKEATAAIFVNADQPFLTANVIDTILHRYFQTLAPIVVPVFDGVPGSPVLFARSLFGELMELDGEDGGRKIVTDRAGVVEKVNVVNTRAALDLDTMDQYRAALKEAEEDPVEGIASIVPSKVD